MQHIKGYTIAGAIFVLITGTLAHFLYEWTNDNFIVGLFTPINESTWEHMKLIFFPMLLYALLMIWKYKAIYPCITAAFLAGTLAGTWLIPVFFYTYTGILGFNLFIFDFLTFIVSVILAFYLSYHLTFSCRYHGYTFFLCILTLVMIGCFMLFTYSPPSIGLFAEPSASAGIFL